MSAPSDPPAPPVKREAFRFTGSWREFAPIALSNLMLTVVTLGVYRFWGKARERRYLWSRTDFLGEPLEWTGTGKELAIGFLFAVLLAGPPLVFIQFGVQALLLRGHPIVALLLLAGSYAVLTFVFGLARFRSLKYRLSRTAWRGVHGGGEGSGWSYAVTHLRRMLMASLLLGLFIPYAMAKMWNDRWHAMRFGGQPFATHLEGDRVIGRHLLFYVVPVLTWALGLSGAAAAGKPGVTLFAVGAITYLAFALVSAYFYAKFLREGIGTMKLHGLNFRFTARTDDFIWLVAGHVLLVIGTLGIGLAFIGYRNWAFTMRHLDAEGLWLPSELRQEEDDMRQGDGLLDMFDVGAI